ncbi:MAG: 30S ribosomal protein S9 [Candidatus Altiarchaeota archaeon]
MANKIVQSAGKRKTALARATISEGKGVVRVNSILLDSYSTEFARMKIQEAMMIASDHVDLGKINIEITSRGGGQLGQADAIASAIARGLVEWSGGDSLLQKYHDFNRTLIAGDSRQTEVHKPSQSSKGPRHKRQKSYR